MTHTPKGFIRKASDTMKNLASQAGNFFRTGSRKSTDSRRKRVTTRKPNNKK